MSVYYIKTAFALHCFYFEHKRTCCCECDGGPLRRRPPPPPSWYSLSSLTYVPSPIDSLVISIAGIPPPLPPLPPPPPPLPPLPLLPCWLPF